MCVCVYVPYYQICRTFQILLQPCQIRVIVTQGTPSLKSIAKDKDYNCIVERSRCINVT